MNLSRFIDLQATMPRKCSIHPNANAISICLNPKCWTPIAKAFHCLKCVKIHAIENDDQNISPEIAFGNVLEEDIVNQKKLINVEDRLSEIFKSINILYGEIKNVMDQDFEEIRSIIVLKGDFLAEEKEMKMIALDKLLEELGKHKDSILQLPERKDEDIGKFCAGMNGLNQRLEKLIENKDEWEKKPKLKEFLESDIDELKLGVKDLMKNLMNKVNSRFSNEYKKIEWIKSKINNEKDLKTFISKYPYYIER